MRVLITGGAGFIGSHLSDYLIAQGDDVWALDDLSTGYVGNIEHLRSHPRYHFYVESVTNVPLVAELVDCCDVVVHLAAAVGVRLVVDSPVRTIETNIRGTEVVLAAAAKKKKRVLITSTSEVYGKSNAVPFHEDDDLVIGAPVKGRWSYACSKAIDEFLALAYWNERKVPVTIVRLFNTVGPRQTGRYGMVLPNFTRQALLGEPVTIFGDGKQSRCFAYVGDIVEAIAKLIQTDEAAGQVFNLGNNEEVTIEELAFRVRAIAGSTSQVVFIPYGEAYGKGFEDMRRRVPSLEKVNRWIGYRPRTSLEGIIDKVVSHERDALRQKSPALAPAQKFSGVSVE
jgi:UDP-glucose 4-epimerase